MVVNAVALATRSHVTTVDQSWTDLIRSGLSRYGPHILLGAASLGAATALYKMRTRKPVIMVDPLKVSSEGILAGHPLMEGGRIPACQVTVAIQVNDKIIIVGAGIRIENFLVTPTHNGISGCKLFILGNSPTNNAAEEIDVRGELFLAADVSAFPVPESVWAKLGVSQAKLGPLGNEATVTVTSCCDKKYSVGTLQPVKPLGRVNYKSSTQPGFSGSAYMNGSTCVGMHCHGGVQAGGYEILYLYNRLKANQGVKNEDSGDFFLEQAKSGFETEDLGEQVVVRLSGGHYHLTTPDIVRQMRKLRGSTRWDEQVELAELEEELDTRDDYVPESALQAGFPGEGRAPGGKVSQPAQVTIKRSMASSLSESSVKPRLTKRQAMMKTVEGLSLKELKTLVSQMKSKQPSKPSTQQTPVQKPSTQAS